MTAPATIEDALTRTALNPKFAATDKGRVESHPIPDLLAALRHESSQSAASKNHFGLRFVKLVAPGAG